MSGGDWGSLIYLTLLGAVILGYFLVENRQGLSKTAQQAAVWGLIFLGAVAGYGLWGDIRSTVVPRQSIHEGGQRVEVPRAADGHFYLTLVVEGTPVDFIVDTGASEMVLAPGDARRIGLQPEDLRFAGRAMTANGYVPTAAVRLSEVRLGDIADRDVRAMVNGGELDVSLLGMGYLNRFARLEIAGNRLVLSR